MKVPKKHLLFGIMGILIGTVGILAIRLITYKPEKVHYHANFAVFIDGKRELFNNPIYYIETSCGANGIRPEMRAHLHDGIYDVVHVEDHAVTWGQLFNNLGWYIGPNFIVDSDGLLYSDNGNNRLNIVINGQDYTGLGTLTNMVINDQDRVLVSFGDPDKQLLKNQFQKVANNASEYNEKQETTSCSAHNITLSDRLKHLF